MTEEHSKTSKGWSPALLEAAVTRYSTEWRTAIDEIDQLAATFERLAEGMRALSEEGTSVVVTFKSELGQTWWTSFRAAHSDLVPRSPEHEPPVMPHEDQIVLEAVTA